MLHEFAIKCKGVVLRSIHYNALLFLSFQLFTFLYWSCLSVCSKDLQCLDTVALYIGNTRSARVITAYLHK